MPAARNVKIYRMIKQRKQNDLNFLNACDHLNWIVMEEDASKLPKETRREIVIPEHRYKWKNKKIIKRVTKTMRQEGLAFVWLQMHPSEPPYVIIDKQKEKLKIITPPFIFVATPMLGGLVTLNGSYVTYTTNDGDIEQAWTLKHKLHIDKKNLLWYKNKNIIIPELYPDETKH